MNSTHFQVTLNSKRLSSTCNNWSKYKASTTSIHELLNSRRNTCLPSLPHLQFNQFSFNKVVKGISQQGRIVEKPYDPKFQTKTFSSGASFGKQYLAQRNSMKSLKLGKVLNNINAFIASQKVFTPPSKRRLSIQELPKKIAQIPTYGVKLLIPPKKMLCFDKENKSNVLTTDGFFKKHEFISQSCIESQSIKALSKLQSKLIGEWRNVDIFQKPRIKERVLKIIDKLRQLDLDPAEIEYNNVFSTKPFEKEFSKEFMNACKEGKIEEAKKYLAINKYLVYDFDHTHKTALHWAILRNQYKIIEMLLQKHADIDYKDLSSKTPLHYAASKNDQTSCKILLANQADPFVHCNLDLEPRDLSSNDYIRSFFTKARKILIISKWIPWGEKKAILKKSLREINDTEYGQNI